MAEQIPRTELKKGKWYVGRGRGANIGLWEGTCFLTIAEKFDEYVVKREPYYTDESGCFQPFAIVDEGFMVEPFGNIAWDNHYGRRLEFGRPRAGGHANPLTEGALAGTWMASSYLPDGVRIDSVLKLNQGRTYEHTSRSHTEQGIHEELDRGTWILKRDEELLQLQSERSGLENRETGWQIIEFSGTTLMLRWLALASRNLPKLFYRVRPRNP